MGNSSSATRLASLEAPLGGLAVPLKDTAPDQIMLEDPLPEYVPSMLRMMSDNIPAFGCDPSCTIIMTPGLAQRVHSHGLSRKSVVDYLVEYARIPAPALNVRWMIGHHHEPKTVPLPLDPTRSVRKFRSGLHLPAIVAGGTGIALALRGGGGDHGGRVTAKIQPPKNWDELVARYSDYEDGG